MSTKSIRSSGTQLTQRGVNQGNVLVDPISGYPIDVIRDNQGIRRLAVDTTLSIDSVTINTDDLNPQDDGVRIQDPVNNNILHINSDGSIDVNTQINASQDNIAIADATTGNKVKVNADGSINVVASVGTSGVSTPTIANPTLILANTEYSYAFPVNTKRFIIRARGSAKVQVSYVLGQSGIDYVTIYPGNKYEEKDLNTANITTYFQSNKAGTIIEILSWA